MGILSLIATPIGNLEDITLRAIKVLGSVDYLLCEDTRKTGLLLQKLKIKKPQLLSFFEGNEKGRTSQVIKLLKENKKVGLVTNAGTPLISDPGFKLVRECLRLGIKVESIPGASAALTALTSSGLPTDKFLFLGFLPKKAGKRQKLLQSLELIYRYISSTVVIYVSPYRLLKVLEDLKVVFGDLSIVLCRELTKLHEEIRREKVSETIAHFQKIKPKGELTLVFHP